MHRALATDHSPSQQDQQIQSIAALVLALEWQPAC
jgi:hypothetical protein